MSQTIARMERDGLVVVEGDRHLELTESGRARAMHVMRKHRLAERLLADVIGLDWAYVHDEACRWEHVMSEQVERRLLEMLDHPTESPYGNPIPGLDELGDAPAGRFLEGVVNIVDRVAGESGPVSGVIRRLGEPVQFEPELLSQLWQAGVVRVPRRPCHPPVRTCWCRSRARATGSSCRSRSPCTCTSGSDAAPLVAPVANLRSASASSSPSPRNGLLGIATDRPV